MSSPHRRCAIPDCRNAAMRGRATCKHHLGHPDGRRLNQQTRRLASMLTSLESLADLDPAEHKRKARRIQQRIERGDFNQALAPTFTELLAHDRQTEDLTWLIGLNRVALTRILMEVEDAYDLSLALTRLVNQTSRLVTLRAQPIERGQSSPTPPAP
jgi:hypothetical protein